MNSEHAVVLRDGLPGDRVELACRCGWTAWAVGGGEAERAATEHERQAISRQRPGHDVSVRPDADLDAVQVRCSCGWEALAERFTDARRLADRHRAESSPG